MNKFKIIIFILLFSSNLYSQENKVIGDYILTLTKNVTFPDQKSKTSYSIAIFGKNSEVFKYLSTIYKSKKINNLPISLKNINKINELNTHYDVIYVEKNKNRLVDDIYKKIHKTGTLLITNNYDNKDYEMINILQPGVSFQIQTSNLYDEKIIPNDNLIAIGGTKIDLQGLYGKKVNALKEKEEELDKKQKKLDSLSLILNKEKQENLNKSNLLEKRKEELFARENELKAKEKILKEKSLKINAQNNIILIIAIFVVILLILSFIIYRALKQNKRINAQLYQRNEEITLQKEEIETQANEIQIQRDLALKRGNELEEKNKDINASIHYALNIQKAMLPSTNLFSKFFDSFFIHNKPRDIVSGDFYWTSTKNNLIYIIAADCTGHGVPGAFMSMLGMSFLNEIIKIDQIVDTNQILNELRKKVITSLKQSIKNDTSSRDGMDLAMIRYNKETKELQYSGAYNSLFIVSDKNLNIDEKNAKIRIEELEGIKAKLYEIRADRMPIGIYIKSYVDFSKKTFKLQKGDKLYIFSDGYNDMFHKQTLQKFGNKRFKKFLLSINDLSMDKQQNKISENQTEWCGINNQIDDILVIGLKL